MDNVIDILKSSGPMSLDELNLRTSSNPAELATSLESLKERGEISIAGPHADDLQRLSDDEIQNASDVLVELTQSSLRRLTR